MLQNLHSTTHSPVHDASRDSETVLQRRNILSAHGPYCISHGILEAAVALPFRAVFQQAMSAGKRSSGQFHRKVRSDSRTCSDEKPFDRRNGTMCGSLGFAAFKNRIAARSATPPVACFQEVMQGSSHFTRSGEWKTSRRHAAGASKLHPSCNRQPPRLTTSLHPTCDTPCQAGSGLIILPVGSLYAS